MLLKQQLQIFEKNKKKNNFSLTKLRLCAILNKKGFVVYIFKNGKPPYKKVCIGIRGQYGDILMQEPGLRKFIKNNPDTKITLAVSKKFKEILPLFYNYHDNIVEFKHFEGYNDWPTTEDLNYINERNFDAMFPPDIPKHQQNNWAKYRHIVKETALMIGLEEPDDIKINLNTPHGLVKEPKTASIHMFSSKWPGGVRSINIQKQNLIVDHLIRRGYKVYQISSPSQPHIKNTTKPIGNYYDACLNVLKTDFLISCDSGMPFLASAFDHPTLTLFSSGYNPLVNTTKNWHPSNPNAIYMESDKADNISIYKIYDAIDNLIRKTK